MVPKFSSQLTKILRGVNTSKQLEKIAADFQDDPEVFEKASMAKIMVDAEIFGILKQAGIASELGRKALTGAAYGAGVVLPVALGGSYLLGRAGDETRESVADMRNKALQTALGVGAVGAGLYGLHHLANRGEKQASFQEEEVMELTEKLAAVGMIEEMLDGVETEKLSDDAQKLAAEIRAINRGYGVQLLHEASHR